MIRRLLIANRGEIALRIVRACRELGIESVAVYSDVDARAPHVVAADRAVFIGPPPAAQSYLSIPKVIDAARAAEADAIHPGYGFLSENAGFADASTRAGLIFVGPPAAVIAQMGSKIDARRLVAAAGVPIVPGETPDDQSDRGIREAIERVGLPALIKASSGGGGKGMRRVGDEGEIDDAIQAARREAQAAFGDGTLYVERLVDRPRHVEVQIFCDAHGHIVHLFERDCSMQRRHQKVIEESPSPVVTPGLRARITEAAVTAARAARYRNAGTIEFLVDVGGSERTRPTTGGRVPSDLADDAPFYFLEMNTRLQVEHPVTEQVTGRDLVRAQLLVADGEPLPWTQADVAVRGHAIEARVYAEDPSRGFLPQAGTVSRYIEPQRPGVRVDAGIVEGGEVSIHYDPMIAKVIATAETRELAIARLSAALREFTIDGVRTNLPFLISAIESPAFRRGAVDTAFLDREGAALAEQTSVHTRNPSVADQGRVFSRDSKEARAIRASGSGRPDYDPWSGPTSSTATAPRASALNEPVPRRRAGESASGGVTAPMPATIIKVCVKPGDAVKKGDTLLVLEAMKMELPIRAPGDGTVSSVCCREGELVQADKVLIEFR
jgi:acetyl/propionyl-CoA carboxylase alpha subunit